MYFSEYERTKVLERACLIPDAYPMRLGIAGPDSVQMKSRFD
jgi:hypothetical protein